MSAHLDDGTLDRLGELDGEGRGHALEHLGRCAACRARLVSRDPSRLFSLLATRPIPQDTLEQVSAGVAKAIREPSRAGAGPRPRWLVFGAAAAGILLAVVMAVRLVRTPPPTVSGPVPHGVEESLAVAAGAVPHLAVELLNSDGSAQVFDLTVGDTQIVMILDEGLEL